jgi:predicted amidohydrolase YtcJ
MLGKYLSLGITGVCEVFRTPETVNKIKLLADNGLLPLRMSFNYSPDIGLSVEDAIKKMDLAPLKCGEGNHFFKAGPLKTYIDGGMLTATAYMNEPYGKPASLMFGGGSNDYRGVTNYTDSEILGKIIDSARKKGWNFTAHCTGDGSASLLLDAYESIHAVKSISGERYQILHANFMSQDLLDKCAKMGIILDIQPVWLYRDAKAIEFWFGKKRSRDFHPWRSALKKGIRLCAGSDHMDGLDPDSSVNPYNPWLGIYSFCARKGDKGDVFGKDEALTREEALRAYTINNAYKSGEEKIKGSIEAGKLADFIVLRKNPFTCDLEELPAIRPHIVAVDGVIKRVS